jgi:hypothetical protein
MNQYRALGPWTGLYGEDVFDADYTVDEERALLDDHVLEIVPRQYRVVSDRYTVNGQPIAPGEVLELAMPADRESSLVDGGHLTRVRRDALPTVEVEPEPESDPKQPRRRRTASPIKE